MIELKPYGRTRPSEARLGSVEDRLDALERRLFDVLERIERGLEAGSSRTSLIAVPDASPTKAMEQLAGRLDRLEAMIGRLSGSLENPRPAAPDENFTRMQQALAEIQRRQDILQETTNRIGRMLAANAKRTQDAPSPPSAPVASRPMVADMRAEAEPPPEPTDPLHRIMAKAIRDIEAFIGPMPAGGKVRRPADPT